MLKCAIRFVECNHEQDRRDLYLNKAKALAPPRGLHDQMVHGPPLASGQHAPIEHDQATPTTTAW